MTDEHGNNIGYFDAKRFKTRIMCLPVQHPMYGDEKIAEQMLAGSNRGW